MRGSSCQQVARLGDDSLPVLESSASPPPPVSPKRRPPHVVCREASGENAENRQAVGVSNWVHFCIMKVVSMILPFTTAQPITFAPNPNGRVPCHTLSTIHLQSCCKGPRWNRQDASPSSQKNGRKMEFICRRH